jgi:hypothetical protein
VIVSTAMKLARLAFVVGLLAGCTGPNTAPYTPVEKKTDHSAETLYQAAEGALLDAGYLIETRDPQGFKLKTQERTLLGSEIKKDKYKYVWVVETGGGKLAIRMECSREAGEEREDCGAERPEKLVNEQDKLVTAILAEASSK